MKEAKQSAQALYGKTRAIEVNTSDGKALQTIVKFSFEFSELLDEKKRNRILDRWICFLDEIEGTMF
jgi:hypothetical protein